MHHSVRVTPTNDTRSRPVIRFTPNASCVRKEWIPRPKRFSDERATPSLRTVRKWAARIAESLAGIAFFPRASATNQGGHRGARSTMVGRWERSRSQRNYRGPRGWCLGRTHNSWAEPRRNDKSKVTRVAPISVNPVFIAFPIFLVPWISLLRVQWYDLLPSEGNQKYRICLAQTLLQLIYIAKINWVWT